MPELPEVETIKRDLSKLIVGKKIADVTTDTPKQVKPSLKRVKPQVVGAKITKVSRRAKMLLIFLSNGRILAFHLKMTGRLLYRKKLHPKDRWTHVVLKFSANDELRFADSRKFGWMKLIKTQRELGRILKQFGPEPMDDLNLKKFRKIIASTPRPVKVLLMDQKKISGVGNIYACDALFLAGIDPRRPANKLDGGEIKKLFEAVVKVLKAGIRYRGASDQYYLDALGHQGSYQDHFLVYGREGERCFGCRGKVAKIKLAGRGTYYCPDCQQ